MILRTRQDVTEAVFRQACDVIAQLGQRTSASHPEVVPAGRWFGVSALVCLLNDGAPGLAKITAFRHRPGCDLRCP